MKKVFIYFSIIAVVPLSLLLAQANGSPGTSIPTSTRSVPSPSVGSNAISSSSPSVSTSTSTMVVPRGISTSTSNSPNGLSPRPKPVVNIISPATSTVASSSSTEPNNSSNNPIPIIVVSTVVLMLGAYIAFKSSIKTNKTKDKEDKSRCFDIKKLMEEKLDELTDLEGRLEDKTKEKVEEKIMEGLEGTFVGQSLVIIKKKKEEYEKLKKLYQQCISDFEIKKQVAIIFEAHGTTFDNESHLSSGHNDVALSPLGEKQSREMGERYKNDNFDAVFCSDLQRSYKSAEIAFGDKFPIIKDARLRECDYGDFTEHPSEEVDKQKSLRITKSFPNGESYMKTTERMKSFLEDLKKDYNGKRVMIIGHRATQYGLDHLINGVPLEQLVSTAFKWQPGWKYYI